MTKKIDALYKLVNEYQVNTEEPVVHRFINFMYAVKKALPETRVSKQIAAKIAFAFPKNKFPAEDSDYVQKMSGICAQANGIIHDRDSCYIVLLPGDGFIVLDDPAEIQLLTVRPRERRIRSAVTKQVEASTVVMRGIKKIDDKDVREEARKSASFGQELMTKLNERRALPPAKYDDIKKKS